MFCKFGISFVKVLWKLVGDFTKEICSCVVECQVDLLDKWFEQFEELKLFIDENEETPTEKTNKKLLKIGPDSYIVLLIL